MRQTSPLRPYGTLLFLLVVFISTNGYAQQTPSPPGELIDIGGQRIHLNCTGSGSPTVLLESGTGDISVIWSRVQPGVSKFTKVCSYDRGGYAWSEPGTRPRTFAQLALELHTALDRKDIQPPYILVGQSYGGLVIRGFAARYPKEVSALVMVDAVHEDQRVVYGGQPHRIRDGVKGLSFPQPHISLDNEFIKLAKEKPALPETALEFPLNLMPANAQLAWRWANTQPLLEMAQEVEREWSPEELELMHNQRLKDRVTFGDLLIVVLARTEGGYAEGMSISATDLEKERRELQADLAHLSRNGRLIFAAHSGHNIHLEDPDLVVRTIREMVNQIRRSRRGTKVDHSV